MTDRDLSGAEVARRHFTDAVEPLLSQAAPRLEYAAAVGTVCHVAWHRLPFASRGRQIRFSARRCRRGPQGRQRENALASACEVLLEIQRERGLPVPKSAVIPFFDQPYRTVDQAVPDGLLAGAADPDVARLPPTVGAIEQWADSTDVLSSPGRRTALQAAYRAWADAG